MNLEETLKAAGVDPVLEKDFEQRCYRGMGALLEEASRDKLLPTFVWVATWHLAAIVRACGNRAMADILRQLGSHVQHIVDCELAEAEAARAKADGRLPS